MMRIAIKPARTAAIFALLGAASLEGSVPTAISAAWAAAAPTVMISEEAGSAIAQMEKTLRAERFSFRARILRVYPDTNGQPLHVAQGVSHVAVLPRIIRWATCKARSAPRT